MCGIPCFNCERVEWDKNKFAQSWPYKTYPQQANESTFGTNVGIEHKEMNYLNEIKNEGIF